MSNYSDFSSHGYQVIRELGRNREAGRITYLATTLNSEQQVVIKEFRFADTGANWSGFKAYQREIEVLQQLAHPRIPRYLNSFETPAGFCLVQEYKNAPSLGESRSFNPEEIQQIAVSVLEILVYLQKRVPPVIHRDIKPENILVDEQRNAYLVDFGFARIRGGEMAVSSVAAGTVGFMPPEEQFGRSLTEASDIYSLGATLICLVTGTRSVDIGKLIDDNYRFDFKKLVPQLSPQFADWLTKMVEPNLKNRYPSASVALESLFKSIQVREKTSKLGVFGAGVKPVAIASVLGLATVGLAAILGGTLANFRSERAVNFEANRAIATTQNSVRRLLFARQCPRCDLRNADLRGANLEGVNLRSANLEGADLGGANLGGSKLESANLEGTNLGSANLGNANLGGANLGNANIGGANLENANLSGANLRNAKLWDAKLWNAKLWDANLKDANLGGANLGGADLQGANLQNANLRDAKLWDAKLWDANLEGAYLQDADLRGANLNGAYLQNAYLGGAKLQGADMQGADLKGAILPDGTKNE